MRNIRENVTMDGTVKFMVRPRGMFYVEAPKMEPKLTLECPKIVPKSSYGPSWTLLGGQGRPMRAQELPKSGPRVTKESSRGS